MTEYKNQTTENKFNIKTLTTTAMMCAIICIISPFSIPIGPVPVSLSLLAVYLCAFLFEKKQALSVVTLYILIGLLGLPVFSGFTGGLPKLIGPTGGYIIGYLPLVFITALFLEKTSINKWFLHFIGALIGLLTCYATGTIWFVITMKVSVSEALALCVYPFVIFDLLKIICAYILSVTVKKILIKSELF